MNLQELAGQFAGEPSYSLEEPQPEPVEEEIPPSPFATFGSAAAGSLRLMTGGIGVGKSFVVQQMIHEMEKVGQAFKGAQITSLTIDDVEFEAVSGFGGHFEMLPEANNFKAMAAAKKRKDRGQKFPGTGWGKRK